MAKNQPKKVRPGNVPLNVPNTDHATSAPTASEPVAAARPAARTMNKKQAPQFLFDATNYKWMIGGVVLIILGFVLMSGGKSDNPNEFHYDQIYSFRRVTLAPIVVLLGFAVEFYAIMRKPKTVA